MFQFKQLILKCSRLHYLKLKLRTTSPINNRSMSTSNKCIVAICQFTATNDKENNFKVIETLVSEAAGKNAQMAFLPEASDYVGTSREETKSLAEPLDGPLMTKFKALAQKHNLWLSVGGFHEKISEDNNKGKMYNAHVLIDNTGNIKAIYRKLHLFDVNIPERNVILKESDDVCRGEEIVSPIDTPAGPLGLSICYDVRFPELSLLLRKKGASILSYPSAFTSVTGKAHWELLVRTRAIESQCYVIAAAQYGKHNAKRASHGQAMVVDPWGRIVAECPKYSEDVPTNQSIAIATIDSDLIARVRQDMPVLQHRRDDIYRLTEVAKGAPSIDSVPSYMFGKNKIPSATVFYRSKYSFAFTNIRCVLPGHVLISSLRPVSRLPDLNQEELSDFFETVVKVQKVIETVQKTSSSTVCIQDGKDAGQTVEQVHCHILPRKAGDFEHNDVVYLKLAQHDQEGTKQARRSLEEQIEEAKLLRKYF